MGRGGFKRRARGVRSSFLNVGEYRTDPVSGRWILVASERGRRPNDFTGHLTATARCPFCPGNEADTPPAVLTVPGSENNWQIRVFANKFPAVTPDGPAYGFHEVIVEAPEHDLSFIDFPAERLLQVLEVYQRRIEFFRANARLKYAFLFKNHGQAAGASRIHPHSQLIALERIPRQIELELLKRSGEDPKQAELIVLETQAITVICPSAPRFPFETWLRPKDGGICFEASTDLAEALHATLQKMRRITDMSAYNLCLHTGPDWRLEIIPRTTRLAGFELGTGVYIHEISPEQAARALRGV